MKKRSLIPLILLLTLLLSSCELIVKQNPKPTINFVSVALKYEGKNRLNGTLNDQDLMIEELRLLSEKAGYNFHSYRFREEDGVYTTKTDDEPPKTLHDTNLRTPLKKFFQGIDSFMQTDSDILIFYYSGHGANDGSLVMCGTANTESTRMTPDELYSLIKSQRGKKLILLDSCFSGHIVTDTAGTLESDEIFSEGWSTLFGKEPSNNGNTWVMTASQKDNYSWESEISRHGAFTHYLLKGLGADPRADIAGTSSTLYSMDGILTLAELYAYVNKHVAADIYNQAHDSNPQSQYGKAQITQNATSVLDLVLFKF